MKMQTKEEWGDNIQEWTGLSFAELQNAVHDCDRWSMIVRDSLVVPLQLYLGL